jgi:hypothetical protein
VAALLTALALALVSSVLVTFAASPADAVRPKNDHPRLPRSCVAPADLIPLEPTLCELNTYQRERPTLLVWGDSHAWQMIPGLRRAAEGTDINLLAVVMGGCPPMDNQLRQGEPAPGCFKSNDLAIRTTRDLVRTGEGVRVLLAASWQRYRQALKTGDRSYTGEMARAARKGSPELVRTLRSLGVEADVVGQVATVPENVAPCRAGNEPYVCDVPRRQALADSVGTKRYLTRLIKPLQNASLINVNGFFCDARVCRGKTGKLHTWWDDLHISATMSRKLRRYLEPTVAETDALRPPNTGGPGCSIPILC